jgi:hypothetical protein
VVSAIVNFIVRVRGEALEGPVAVEPIDLHLCALSSQWRGLLCGNTMRTETP